MTQFLHELPSGTGCSPSRLLPDHFPTTIPQLILKICDFWIGSTATNSPQSNTDRHEFSLLFKNLPLSTEHQSHILASITQSVHIARFPVPVRQNPTRITPRNS